MEQPNLIIEYDCSPVREKPCYAIIDRLTGTTEEFDSLSQAFRVGCNLARDLKVKVDCPSYVLMSLWLDGLVSYDDITPILDEIPIEKEIVESWGGRLQFMNGPIGPIEENDAQ